MRMLAKKFGTQPKAVECRLESSGVAVVLNAKIWRVDAKLLRLQGVLSGKITLIDDLSGEEFEKVLREPLDVYLSDGIWDGKNTEHFEVVEFFDGFVDVGELLAGEVESIRLDYHTKGE